MGGGGGGHLYVKSTLVVSVCTDFVCSDDSQGFGFCVGGENLGWICGEGCLGFVHVLCTPGKFVFSPIVLSQSVEGEVKHSMLASPVSTCICVHQSTLTYDII